jgi:two-component system, NarL family, response regulator NreC
VSTRVLLADDHAVIRSGLRALLSGTPDLVVVGEACDGAETLRLAAELAPDVVVLDVSMPDLNGIEVTRRLLQQQPALRVLILTMHEDGGLLQEAIRAGAAGYVVKRAAEAEIVFAVRAVLRGDLYVHPAMTRSLLCDKQPTPTARRPHVPPLTPREVDVLRLIARGCTNRQVAERLKLSVRTAECHRASLNDKLGLTSRVELVSYAQANRLLE